MAHSITDQHLHLQTIKKNNSWIIYSSEVLKDIEAQWFTQDYWMNQGRLLGANSGRGSTWVIKSDWGKWVLRHYYRGGLYAKFNKDKYLWTGLENTRAHQEFQLLKHIAELNLPSPKPIAALISKKGLFYQNDLIMSHVQHECTFAHGISSQKLPTAIWSVVGETIARYHQHGIYHSDLNAHNILLNLDNTTAQVHLIDFDKGRLRKPQAAWQQENLNRLKRSIEKITTQSTATTLKDQWHALTSAYQEHQA